MLLRIKTVAAEVLKHIMYHELFTLPSTWYCDLRGRLERTL